MFTVYIIDDDQQTANMLGMFVQLMGFESKVYTSAKQFFDDDISFSKDSILILDLIMPDMDGIEVMRRLADIENTPPLILISGYDSGVLHSAEQLAKAHSLNIIDTLTKPLNFDGFKDVMHSYTRDNKCGPNNSDENKFQVTVCELEDAILNNQFVLHYQPQIDLKSGSLSGVEALVRWQHPVHGLIYPDLFIPLAEKNGLIGDLTAQIIGLAVGQTLLWKEQKLIVQVSVNISAENITSLTLPEQLSNMLDDNKLDPSMLTLEITESALMGELVTSLDILTRLRMKGVELSIDDFGTGYSSLSQLYRVPFTELKIDRTFVGGMMHDDEAKGIVKTCIMLGHELNMHVVAEGVEDSKTLALLKELECDIAQGYSIAKPMPAEDLIDWSRGRDQYSIASS